MKFRGYKRVAQRYMFDRSKVRCLTGHELVTLPKFGDENGQLIIDLTSRSLALLVEISLTDADVVFSDNYFNLPVNRTTRISCPLPAGWTLDKARKALQLRSVYDSFSHGAVK